MTTATPYTLTTTEDESGTVHPAEALWTPTPEDAVKAGFTAYNGVVLTGINDEDEPVAEFLALGHGHTWRALWDAATAYMQATYAVPDLYTDPDTKRPVQTPSRPQIPKQRHAVLIRHPHPDHPCGCAWDDTWRLVYVDADEPGAVEVTVMRNPAVTA